MALKMRDRSLVKEIFEKVPNGERKDDIQMQMAYILRQNRYDYKDEENWSEKVGV